jgi:ABC-type transport system involved in cytochrome bd biosynthesis fused ATPase/permease subunit
MSVDVDIYMNNIIKFFKQNQKDLLNLVPKDKEEEFYDKIREVAKENSENGKEVSLTQKQLIDVCRELNQKKVEILQEIPASFIKTKFGFICLN